MLPRMLRWFVAVLLVVSLSLPFAAAQPDAAPPRIERGVQVDTSDDKSNDTSTAAFPYFMMAVYTMLVLTIVCMPSRQA